MRAGEPTDLGRVGGRGQRSVGVASPAVEVRPRSVKRAIPTERSRIRTGVDSPRSAGLEGRCADGELDASVECTTCKTHTRSTDLVKWERR